MQPQARDAPILHIVATQTEANWLPSRLDSASADLSLVTGARMRARRGQNMIHYAVPAIPPDADLLHPYLAPGAALAWQWAGYEALHSGAIATPRGAVLLLGDKESGKSTTLAWLARHRAAPVIADDLAVIVRGKVLAGPRCIDLRTGPAAQTDAAVRNGQRLRVTLPEVPSALEVAGVAILSWGDQVTTSPVPVSERPATLARQRTYPRLGGDEVSLLELAALPMFTLERPRTQDSLAAASEALLGCFCSSNS